MPETRAHGVADLSEFRGRLRSQHPEWLEAVRTQKALSDDLENQLKSVLDDFSNSFA